MSFIGLAAFVEGLSESSLTEIKVDPENPYFSEKDGVVFSKDGTKLIMFPSGRSGDYQIPDGTVIRISDILYAPVPSPLRPQTQR